ncbi:uncharacterized protein Eint_111100 [Encephalitozoon intestinalis ATCC 50506]|uniref:Cytoplasmic tRNA 2-thiolation protein 2 n=1 Tax=Encephalitozoon intestinalis (strain ATCC 50506) TaxID=876142 RepID=E0S9Y8_ENCIT|nr:uncharacterized protein Eint_111100 [Encephalitozoon intestinalis ATCC 50506]ADM12610.1 hypothetical protein Eint_111100 [Encephalitozoon intestinalis ATCC 50506]UTX46469.1 tRNA-5-methyluridine(54) 2-sulfurtransferase [Encephalitozoon intestinalis]
MEHRCIICTAAPNIRISNLDYCDTCFEKQFLHKVFRHFRKLPRGSKILLYLDGTLQSLVIAHALSRLKNRSIHKFSVASSFIQELKNYLGDMGFSSWIDLRPESDKYVSSSTRLDPLPRQTIEIAQSLGFDIVVFQADAEIESLIALRSICNGLGVSESIESYVSGIRGIRVENALNRIRSKEVGYYFYLNRGEIPTTWTKLSMSTMEAALLMFIEKIEDRNNLAVFNILNTVKKIQEGKEGIDTSDGGGESGV